VILGVCFRWNGLDRFQAVFGGTVSGGAETGSYRFSVKRLSVWSGFRWNGYRFRPVFSGTVTGSHRFSVERSPVRPVFVTVASLSVELVNSLRVLNFYIPSLRCSPQNYFLTLTL
jgi:hypothetical protein